MRGIRDIRQAAQGAARRRRWWRAALLVTLLGPGLPLDADEAAELPSPRASTPAPAVPLDRLFELPSGFEPRQAERKGGVAEPEWRQRFRDARGAVAERQAALDRSKAELEEMAESSDAWAVAPPVPGVSQMPNNDAPLNYQLRQRLNREKEELEEAKRDLLDLEVEANLAGVPEAWRTE